MYAKCDTTGKKIFTSLAGAREVMYKFRVRFTDHVTGKRRNRKTKKPAQKRAYYCQYCNGYHLTSQEVYKNNSKNNDVN